MKIMAASKRIGFFWGEEKVTLVEFEKNTLHQVVSSPLGAKTSTASPFSSSLTEEIQITSILKQLLQDNHITGGSFYVSLPMKEIILRSFSIPFVKPENVQNAIKFEAKKYVPFDIQDLSYVFHTVPFTEGQNKRLQVIFFAARKEVWARYERIFKQVNVQVAYCEPYIVSLAKALLFRKEIKPTEHLAFLSLDKNLGRICFINKGIPQFIREFPIASVSAMEDTPESAEVLHLRIVTEVVNSFDFYARQFNGEKIEQVLVSSDFIQQDLISALEIELKVKITKFSPLMTTGGLQKTQSNDLEAVYAMGACVTPPIESLSEFNFLQQEPKVDWKAEFIKVVKPHKELVVVFILCVILMVGVFILLEFKLKLAQAQYARLSAQQGEFQHQPQESIQSELQQNTEKLAKYKSIRTKSDVTGILLKIASHLPQGALISDLNINYEQDQSGKVYVIIDMKGNVVGEDANEQIAIVNQVYSNLKNDQELSKFFGNVTLVSFNPEVFREKQSTAFNIKCS